MPAGTPILLSAAHGDHLARVRRDTQEGHLGIAHWTADRPDRVAGTRLEGLEPARIGVQGWRLAPAQDGALGERIFRARCGHNDGAASMFWGG